MFKETRSFKVPEVHVKNKVLWLNPNLQLPFDLTLGQNTPLGMFVVDPKFELPGSFHLGTDSLHGRSGYLGRIMITDTKDNIYFDHDLKGIGYLNGNLNENPTVSPIIIRDRDSTSGLWRLEKAQREVIITEDLITQGVRTYRIGALIGLEEIALPDGSKLSVTEAKSRGLMHPDETPVIGLRVYRFRERVGNLYGPRATMIIDAKNIVEKERGITLGWQEFLVWYSQTLGSNVAAMHKAGYWHGALDPHNVTLAAEIVDFGLGSYSDSKKLIDLSPRDRKAYLYLDYRLAYDCMRQVSSTVQWSLEKADQLVIGTHFGKIFYDAYKQTSVSHIVPAEDPVKPSTSQQISKLRQGIARILRI